MPQAFLSYHWQPGLASVAVAVAVAAAAAAAAAGAGAGAAEMSQQLADRHLCYLQWVAHQPRPLPAEPPPLATQPAEMPQHAVLLHSLLLSAAHY